MKSISHISDQMFFGEWDPFNEIWTRASRLNYSYSPKLYEIEAFVKMGDYTAAKNALLKYFRNRTEIPRADFDISANKECVYLNMQDVYSFAEPYITRFTVENACQYKEYTIDLGMPKSCVFLLSSFDKTKDMVCIASRESEYSPRLEIVCDDQTSVELLPIRDTYIRGFDNVYDYSKRNYGRSEELYIKDSYYQTPEGRYKPYSSQSRRTYIAFDESMIPSNATKAYLKLYAKIVPEEGSFLVSESAHEIHIFSAYNMSWAEHEDEISSFAPMTWADFKISHYSWKSIPGGFDWVWPENCPSEYFNYNTRFYGITSIAIEGIRIDDNRYLDRAIELTLDFIQDTAGKIKEENIPAKRDIESADRCCRLPGLFAAFLDYDGFDVEAMTDILKWLWEEMTYLYNGAGILYNGATSEPTPNNYAETNRGLWHVKGMEGICTYFPEYSDRNMWKKLADERLNTVAHVLVNDDGCYQEATFGYASSMVSYFLTIYKYLQHSGDPIPDWFDNRLHNFLFYLMYNSYPNHQTTHFGEGGAPNTVGAIKQYLALSNDDELRYVASDGAEGVKPSKTAACFEQLKTVACRTGWSTQDSMIFMSAKNGGNHNHKDSLMLTFFAGDKELIADTGMTSYDGQHPHFKWQRHTTRSHNTIEIDQKPQRGSNFLYNNNPNLPNGDSFLVLYPGTTVDKIESWTDVNEGFRHYRNVSYIKSKNLIIVSDMVSPDDCDTASHFYTQNWHTYAPLPSYPEISNDTKVGKTNYKSGSNLCIFQMDTKELTLTLEEGYSALSSAPTQYFCYSQEGVGARMYNTVLCPFWDGAEVEISARNIDVDAPNTASCIKDISVSRENEEPFDILYYNSFEKEPSLRSFGIYSTDSTGSIILQNSSAVFPSFISMYNGSCLLRDNSTLVSCGRRLENIEITFESNKAYISSKDENIRRARITVASPEDITSVFLNGEEVEFDRHCGMICLGSIILERV